MKRIISCLTVCIIIAALFAPIASAHVSAVDDGAVLLEQSEIAALSGVTSGLSQAYEISVFVVTANSTGGKTAMEYADDYYDARAGINTDGILLLIDMGGRNVWISTSGRCISAFTDYGIELILDDIFIYLPDGDYFNAINQFLSDVEDYMDEYINGTPIDVYPPAADPDNPYYPDYTYPPYTPPVSAGTTILAMVVLGVAVALIVLRIMMGMMRTVRQQFGAAMYQQPLELTRSSDIFLYSQTTRRKVVNESHSSGGGGGGSSTHTSSSGGTHGGGGRSF